MIRNVHVRTVPLPPDVVGVHIERLLEPGVLWPKGWPMIRMDNGLEVGSNGGHGPIGYSVMGYQPGRRIEFRFSPTTMLDGTHALEIYEGWDPGTTVVRHILVGETRSWMTRLRWILAVRWMHDQVVEELLANLARVSGDSTARAPRWSVWVRLVRKFAPPPVPAG